MRGVIELDIMEACSVLSSLGTLAIAVTSWCQIRRDARVGYVPVVVIDDFAWCDGELVARVRNCGTGPALDVKMWGMWGRDAVPIEPMVDGRRMTALHLAPNEARRVCVLETPLQKTEKAADVMPQEIRIRYHSVRGRTFEGRAEIPRDLSRNDPVHANGQARSGLPE
ncbi:hypothetical protein [Alicyclobacillus fructus]|uniref:hypothetical protein n=1 Tax=Alicyclobacillus fructus TaxID=2816082 RepID=UPI001A8E1354|nr:hypothetical protein [Alicyclobacillus fructus]